MSSNPCLKIFTKLSSYTRINFKVLKMAYRAMIWLSTWSDSCFYHQIHFVSYYPPRPVPTRGLFRASWTCDALSRKFLQTTAFSFKSTWPQLSIYLLRCSSILSLPLDNHQGMCVFCSALHTYNITKWTVTWMSQLMNFTAWLAVFPFIY